MRGQLQVKLGDRVKINIPSENLAAGSGHLYPHRGEGTVASDSKGRWFSPHERLAHVKLDLPFTRPKRGQDGNPVKHDGKPIFEKVSHLWVPTWLLELVERQKVVVGICSCGQPAEYFLQQYKRSARGRRLMNKNPVCPSCLSVGLESGKIRRGPIGFQAVKPRISQACQGCGKSAAGQSQLLPVEIRKVKYHTSLVEREQVVAERMSQGVETVKEALFYESCIANAPSPQFVKDGKVVESTTEVPKGWAKAQQVKHRREEAARRPRNLGAYGTD